MPICWNPLRSSQASRGSLVLSFTFDLSPLTSCRFLLYRGHLNHELSYFSNVELHGYLLFVAHPFHIADRSDSKGLVLDPLPDAIGLFPAGGHRGQGRPVQLALCIVQDRIPIPGLDPDRVGIVYLIELVFLVPEVDGIGGIEARKGLGSVCCLSP